MSNLGLEVALKSKNINLYGHRSAINMCCNLCSKMIYRSAANNRGHIIFPFRSLVGDGMLTQNFLLSKTMFETGKSLEDLVAGFQRFPQILVNVKLKKNDLFEEVAEIVEASKQVEAELAEKVVFCCVIRHRKSCTSDD